MDRSIQKRPVIQKQRQTSKIPFGSVQPVPKVLQGRAQNPRYFNNNPDNVSSPDLDRKLTDDSVQKPSIHASVASRIPIDMDLPGPDSPLHKIKYIRRKKWHRARLIATRGTAVILVLLITMGGLLFSQTYFKLNKVFKGTTGTVAALKPNVNPDLLKGEGSGRVNVLLLGRGGDDNHNNPDITSSIMVASIDPINYKATLISIPANLWVNVPGEGVMKIDAAWEKGESKYFGGKTVTGSTNTGAVNSGFSLVDQTLGQVLGINIDYNILVNFQAFQQAVDTVGGITVNVPTSLVDPTIAWQNSNNPTIAQAGTQNFDGAQALLYVRSVETTSDFSRDSRQRAVLMAIESKVENLGTLSNPLKIESLINTFGNNVQTDLSLSNASRLYSITKKITSDNTVSTDLATAPNQYVTTGNIAGQSIVLPTAGLFNYGPIQQYMHIILKDPYIIKENAKVLILNGTDMPGLATKEASLLETYGYNVIGVANTPNSNWSKTTLVNLAHGKYPYTQHYLEERLGVKAVNSLSDKSIPTNGADFVIIIGSNEVNSTQTQTN